MILKETNFILKKTFRPGPTNGSRVRGQDMIMIMIIELSFCLLFQVVLSAFGLSCFSCSANRCLMLVQDKKVQKRCIFSFQLHILTLKICMKNCSGPPRISFLTVLEFASSTGVVLCKHDIQSYASSGYHFVFLKLFSDAQYQ